MSLPLFHTDSEGETGNKVREKGNVIVGPVGKQNQAYVPMCPNHLALGSGKLFNLSSLEKKC